jgi:hypothetical protein
MTANDDIKRQLREMEQALSPAECELWAALKMFIDSEEAAGLPRDRAYERARNVLRMAKDERARNRRSTFKVID